MNRRNLALLSAALVALAGVAVGLGFAFRKLRRSHPPVVVAVADGGEADAGESETGDGGPVAPRLAIEGLVRMGGKPVGGARVELGGAGKPQVVQSGPDGSFLFAALPEGRFALRATRDLDAAFVPEVVAEGAAKRQVTVLELKRGVRLAGHLRDRAGKPIANGDVVIAEDVGAPLPRQVQSGFDGSFHLDAVLLGKYAVWGRAPGFIGCEPKVVSAPGSVELVLERAACVEGRIVDESARAVSGASVEVGGEAAGGVLIAVTAAAAAGDGRARLDPAGELGILRGPLPFPPRVAAAPAPDAAPAGFVTDGKGGFKICGVPPGRVVIPAAHPDFLRATSEPMVLAAGASATLQLALHKGASGGGEVFDDRGAALAGARVSVSSAGSTQQSAITGRDGRFRVERLAAGPFRVEVAHPDFVTQKRTLTAFEADTRFEMTVGGGIDGEVRDARSGAAPPGARLTLKHGSDEQALSLKGGRFSASGVAEGAATLVAEAPGYVSWSKSITIPAGSRPRDITVRDLRVELERGGTVEGNVRDDRGDAAVDAEIRIGAARARTDARGDFTVDGVAPGRVTVEASLGGHTAHDQVEVRANERTRTELRF